MNGATSGAGHHRLGRSGRVDRGLFPSYLGVGVSQCLLDPAAPRLEVRLQAGMAGAKPK